MECVYTVGTGVDGRDFGRGRLGRWERSLRLAIQDGQDRLETRNGRLGALYVSEGVDRASR